VNIFEVRTVAHPLRKHAAGFEARAGEQVKGRAVGSGDFSEQGAEAEVFAGIALQEPQPRRGMSFAPPCRIHHDAHAGFSVARIDGVEVHRAHGLPVRRHEHQPQAAFGKRVAIGGGVPDEGFEGKRGEPGTDPPFFWAVFPNIQPGRIFGLKCPQPVACLRHGREDSPDGEYLAGMVKGFLAAVVVACCAGCTVNKDLMFRTDEDFAFADLATISQEEYRIAPNDLLAFQLYSNGGQRLLAGTAGALESGGNPGVLAQQTANFRSGIPFLVLPDGLDPVPDVASEVLRDINPIVSIVSSLSVLWALLTNAL